MRLSPEQSLVALPYSYVQSNGANSYGSPNGLRLDRTWTGSVTPGFPRVKRTNSHSVLKRTVSSFGSLKKVKRYPTLSGYTPYIVTSEGAIYQGFIYNRNSTTVNTDVAALPSGCPYFLNDLSHDMSSYNRALDAAIDAVLNQQVNLAQVFAERAQAVRMIYESANRIFRAMYAVKKLDYQSVLRELGYHSSYPKQMHGNMGKDWLAFQYGWKPLLADVRGSAELLASAMLKNRFYIKVKKTRSYSEPGYLGYRTPRFDNDDLGQFNYSFSPKETTSKVSLTFDVTNEFLREGKTTGILDPLTLAWELLPYSFVIDWFLPVGDFLKRLNYDSGLRYVDGYSVQHTTQSWLFRGDSTSYTPPGYNYTVTTFGTPAFGQNLRFDRKWLNVPPRPMWPSFKDPFSPTHVLNALALMRTGIRWFR